MLYQWNGIAVMFVGPMIDTSAVLVQYVSMNAINSDSSVAARSILN